MKTKPLSNTKELQTISWEMRIKCLEMIYNASSGHIGGSFSAAEILTVLYFYKARLKPDWEHRDRIFISKGHCAPILYAILARRGFFNEKELETFRRLGSRLQGHPVRGKLPGIEMSSGPLGLGASVATGAALGSKLKKSDSLVFCLLGDGEIEEGIVWEAAMTANKYTLDNLVFILDYNGYQLSGSVNDTMPLEPLAYKWESFGWRVLEIDGNNTQSLIEAFDTIKRPSYASKVTKPTILIARTRKGFGVSFMENTSKWHGKVPSKDEYDRAMSELASHLRNLRKSKNR